MLYESNNDAAFRICRLIICNKDIKGMTFLQAWEMVRVCLRMYPCVSRLDISSFILIKLIASISFKKRQLSQCCFIRIIYHGQGPLIDPL